MKSECGARPSKDFFDRLPRLKLKSMEQTNKITKLKTSQGNVIRFQEQGDLAFQLLIKSQLLANPISIPEMMTYSLTPVPHCLGTPDGFMSKTNKAVAVHHVTRHVSIAAIPPSVAGKTIYIEDGNAHFHTLKDIKPTFDLISLQILDRLSNKSDIIFSTDSYRTQSIKSQERLRRGKSERFVVEGFNQRKPADFRMFLQNDENKMQFINMLERVWGSPCAASRLNGKNLLLVNDGRVVHMKSEDGETVTVEEVYELRSNQEETDSRVVLYLKYAKEKDYKDAVVSSPDSDIFFILLFHASQLAPLTIYLQTGYGQKRKVYNMSELAEDIGQRNCAALLGLYCFTGEDCNCAFRGKGKIGPMKKMQKKPMYVDVFEKLGSSWGVSEDTMEKLEQFVCFMYGFPRIKHVNEVRSIMLQKMVGEGKELNASSKVDMAKLPPCRDSLIPHVLRVNFRVCQWKMAQSAMIEVPPATENGWMYGESGTLEPVWTVGEMLPSSVEDIVEDTVADLSDHVTNGDNWDEVESWSDSDLSDGDDHYDSDIDN